MSLQSARFFLLMNIVNFNVYSRTQLIYRPLHNVPEDLHRPPEDIHGEEAEAKEQRQRRK
jgi:hypothetical protein